MYASRKLALTVALAIGVAAGSYGIANAASGSGSSSAPTVDRRRPVDRGAGLAPDGGPAVGRAALGRDAAHR